MSNEIRNKKIINGIIGFILFFAILFGGFWLIDNRYTIQLKAQEIDNVNLASPVLTDKEYLGNGVYRIYQGNGVTIDYNVYGGLWAINGTVTNAFNYILVNIEQNTEYTVSYTAVDGTLSGGSFIIFTTVSYYGVVSQVNENVNQQHTFTTTTQTTLRFDLPLGRTFNNYQFKFQLEQGDTATPYQVPLGAIQQHEQIIYDEAYGVGYGVGYQNGYNDAYEGNEYIHMGFDEYEVFNNGFDVIFQLEVLDPLGADTGSTTDLLLYMTQQFETAIWVLPLHYNYYIEIQLLDSVERVSTFVRTLIFNNYLETIEGYRGDGEIDFVIGYGDIVAMGGSQMWARRMLSTGMTEYQEIWNEGHQDGFSSGYDWGYDLGYDDGFDKGEDYGYEIGKDDGYIKGIEENTSNYFGSMITSILLGVGTVLGIQLLPGISIGAIIAVPIVFGIIAFVLGRKRD